MGDVQYVYKPRSADRVALTLSESKLTVTHKRPSLTLSYANVKSVGIAKPSAWNTAVAFATVNTDGSVSQYLWSNERGLFLVRNVSVPRLSADELTILDQSDSFVLVATPTQVLLCDPSSYESWSVDFQPNTGLILPTACLIATKHARSITVSKLSSGHARVDAQVSVHTRDVLTPISNVHLACHTRDLEVKGYSGPMHRTLVNVYLVYVIENVLVVRIVHHDGSLRVDEPWSETNLSGLKLEDELTSQINLASAI